MKWTCRNCDYDMCINCALRFMNVEPRNLLPYELNQFFVFFGDSPTHPKVFKSFDEQDATEIFDYVDRNRENDKGRGDAPPD